MPSTKAASPRSGAGRSSSKPKLPPITVAKFEETGRLLERVVAQNQSMFIEKGQAYKEAHREGSRRPLTPAESAQIAAAIARETNPVQVAEEVQDSELRAYDEPDGREVLLAAGIATAPALVAAVRDVVALVEMPNADFEEACVQGEIDEAISRRATELGKLALGAGRKRASDAFTHYATSAGFDSGEAWRLPVQAVWQALQSAMSGLGDGSRPSQLIDSATSTEDSPESTSSSD